jgi:D-Tyr-tRNAtyr deacylase
MFTIKGEVEKGEKKEIMIEWNGLEGTELYDELVEYFAQKAYQIYCCLYEVVESRF